MGKMEGEREEKLAGGDRGWVLERMGKRSGE